MSGGSCRVKDGQGLGIITVTTVNSIKRTLRTGHRGSHASLRKDAGKGSKIRTLRWRLRPVSPCNRSNHLRQPAPRDHERMIAAVGSRSTTGERRPRLALSDHQASVTAKP